MEVGPGFRINFGAPTFWDGIKRNVNHHQIFASSRLRVNQIGASGRGAGWTGGGGCWHLVRVMSISVPLDLPEAVAAEAKGLLDPKNLTRLIQREVEAESARRDFSIWYGISARCPASQ